MGEQLSHNEAADQDWRPRTDDVWPVLVLATGGVLTLAWCAFLLWAASQAVLWLLR